MTIEPRTDDEIPPGRGTELASWTLAAMGGNPVSPDGLAVGPARRVRRVNYAVAALADRASTFDRADRTGA